MNPDTYTPYGGLIAALACCLGLSWSAPALAHKLTLFAYAANGEIIGETYFSGGTPAQAQIAISDDAGHPLGETRSGPDGHFSYRPGVQTTLQLTATTGDGHRALWQITAEELAGSAAAISTDSAADSGTPPTTTAPSAPGSVTTTPPATDPALMAALERMLASQLGPLRAELMAERERARLHDILGGIGYIFGLTGIVLWLRQRRPHNGG